MTILDKLRPKGKRIEDNYLNTVIIIPTYNEERNIARTIDLIKSTGLNIEIIVVNDGSTDRTSEIARAKGIEVIDLPKMKNPKTGTSENLGKTSAFFAGLKVALTKKPEVIITLDADMIVIPRESLLVLINSARQSTLRKETRMFIATPFEGVKLSNYDSACPPDITGLRAFSLMAAYKLALSKFKSIPKKFALEKFLTDYFTKNETIVVSNAKFGTLPALRTEYAEKRQNQQIQDYMNRKSLKGKKFRRFREFITPNSPLRPRLR